jgi:hypothetical protein
MDNRHRQKGWRETESMSDAASRLLRVLDERSKKRKNSAGEDLGRRQIADRPLSPDENAEERSPRGLGRLDAPPQQFTSLEEASDHTPQGGERRGLEFDGRAELSTLDFVQSFSPQGTARPGSGRYLGKGRTRERHAPEDEF